MFSSTAKKIPRFPEERVELVPSVHRQAALGEPEHRRRVLGEWKARLPGVAGAVDHEVLQGAAEPELDRGERCKREQKKRRNRVGAVRGAHSKEMP